MKKLLLLAGAVALIAGMVVCEKPPEVGALSIESTPTGATIYLDGDPTGEVTPTVIVDLDTVEHTIKLTLEGYLDYEDTVMVKAGDTVTVKATLEEMPGYGALDISSTPSGAQIWLNDENTGAVTDTILDSLTAGEHSLTLQLDGYQDWDSTITIIEDTTIVVEAELSVLTGSLQVNSTPTGAAISLDGSSTGQVTNHLFTDVEVGDHTIGLELDGYADWDTTVTVVADETATVDVTLEEAPMEEITLDEDEATPVPFGFKMSAGDKLAVVFKPPSYPFELTQACYAPTGWQDDPDNWNVACNLVFFGPGLEQPGTELGRKEVSANQQGAFNWFDVSDLDIVIEQDSFYYAVENKVDDNPGLLLDGMDPEHYKSWMYTTFQGEPEPFWAPFDNINVGFPNEMTLGDSVDLMLRVKGMVPGGKVVVLEPSTSIRGSYRRSTVTLPFDNRAEILDWRRIR